VFYHQREAFIPSPESDAVKINKTGNIVESKLINYHHDRLSYGSIIINPLNHKDSIFQWRVKLLAVNNRIKIGIFTSFHGANYSIETTGKLFKNTLSDTIIVGKWGKYYSPQLKTNDIVTIELNIKNRTIRYFVNNINLGVAFRNIDISTHYNFGITLRRNDKVKLLHFNEMISNDEIERNEYDKCFVESLFTFNLDIAELIINILRAHTTAECDMEMELKIKRTITNKNIDAKRILTMGRKQLLLSLRNEANVKLGHGSKAFKFIEKCILNTNKCKNTQNQCMVI